MTLRSLQDQFPATRAHLQRLRLELRPIRHGKMGEKQSKRSVNFHASMCLSFSEKTYQDHLLHALPIEFYRKLPVLSRKSGMSARDLEKKEGSSSARHCEDIPSSSRKSFSQLGSIMSSKHALRFRYVNRESWRQKNTCQLSIRQSLASRYACKDDIPGPKRTRDIATVLEYMAERQSRERLVKAPTVTVGKWEDEAVIDI